ncbi:hypothetical protein PLICRDRAFT_384450 [Plicaturopsis crispa FD-325 SS-3]|nr:hypothetical protein PLICRDRAFT_384450 [Plicaturopsis crispa FD-325 SS-3]
MPIFQDAQGLAVKFFIQKDLPQEIQAELCETITSLGGRVETKVPRQGYILVQQGTPEEERLRLCWASVERPERHFVPYTYVEACKIAGMVLKQIFLHNGEPMKMHIHPSIANVNARVALTQRIMHSGGDPTASAQSARVILADPNTEVFKHLVESYQGQPEKYIESYLWVRKCVEKGSVVYTPLVYKNPGGRRPGEERTQFTKQDEHRLCVWIATKIPYKDIGGRTGNRLYQQLCDMAHDPDYSWVTRHTWQSWRERYKKHSERLDNDIAAIVDEKKPDLGGKGQYGYVRQAEEKPKKPRKTRVKHFPDQPAGDKSPIDVDASADEHADRGMSVGTMPSQPSQLSFYRPRDHDKGEGSSGQRRAATSPAREEVEDTEEGSEWAVRIGNEPTPPWAKRKASEELDGAGSKRQKTAERNEVPVLTWQAAVEPLDPDLHMIDLGIREIATEFRFTPEEVKEYYDRFGDMERARNRFMRMREELRARFPDDE